MGRSKRSSSGGSYKDMAGNRRRDRSGSVGSSATCGAVVAGTPSTKKSASPSAAKSGNAEDDFGETRIAMQQLLDSLYRYRDSAGKSLLHYGNTTDDDDSSNRVSCGTPSSLCTNAALLVRLKQIQMHYKASNGGSTGGNNHKTPTPMQQQRQPSTPTTGTRELLQLEHLHRRFLALADFESGYTPLHWAVYRRDLSMMLLLLRHAASTGRDDEGLALSQNVIANKSAMRTSIRTTHHNAAILPPTLKHRPIELLLNPDTVFTPMTATTNASSPHATVSSSSSTAAGSDPAVSILRVKDHEDMTAGDLLLRMSCNDLLACRLSLPRPKIRLSTGGGDAASRGNRRASFDADDPDRHDDEQNEFDLLSRSLQHLNTLRQREQREQHQQQTVNAQGGAEDDDEEQPNHGSRGDEDAGKTASWSYACEVLTFGSAHHCALGVGQESSSILSSTTEKGHHGSCHYASSVRPTRVQAFALGETRSASSEEESDKKTNGPAGPAVAVAGAAHHTLVATARGHLYAFGLGKGGRLGTGNEQHCPLPTRVRGALSSRHVVSVAAAENHSLCVTKDGEVFAFGSNRFGQLGIATSSSSDNGKDSNLTRCLPRRVDDLKSVFCVSVAAGAKHSVALSRYGEVYVWGDNSAGQLGIPRRHGNGGSGGNNSNGHGLKVQRVEALWNQSSPGRPKVACAIAASDQATMVLTIPTTAGSGIPVNTIYSWGHGSHIPTKVHFDSSSSSSSSSSRTNNNSNGSIFGGHHHPQRTINPVAIACAKFHHFCATSDGQVFTWDCVGTTVNKKKSSTPPSSSTTFPLASPQLVTGMLPENGGGFVVGISASDHHTAVVTNDGALYTWGSTYDQNVLGHEGVRYQPDPKRVAGVTRAVGVAAAKEHTVLLVGTSFPPLPHVKADSSLEMLAARKVAEHVDLFNILPCLITADRTDCIELVEYCKSFCRRNLDGVLTVAQKSVLDCYLDEQLISCLLPTNDRDRRDHPLFSDIIRAGMSRPAFGVDPFADKQSFFQTCKVVAASDGAKTLCSFLLHPDRSEKSKPRSYSEASCGNWGRTNSERYAELTTNMDLSSVQLAEAKRICLTKEVRGVKKRLNQIFRLEDISKDELTSEQREKIARRPQLQNDLLVLEPALEAVETRLKELNVSEKRSDTKPQVEERNPVEVTIHLPEEKKPPEETNSCAREGIPHADEELLRGNATKHASYRCEICKISCPDEKSFLLHNSGRKHMNRVKQQEEEEQRNVAESMMAEKFAKQIMGKTEVPAISSLKSSKKPWQNTSPQQQPPYSLPMPPIPVPDYMVTKQNGPVSLKEIMREESKKTPKAPRLAVRPSPKMIAPRSASAKEDGKLKITESLVLPKGSAPPLKSPPWASSPVASINVSREVHAQASSPAYSLGDFLTPIVQVSKKASQSASKSIGWKTPELVKKMKSAPGPSLKDIQEQEKELKARQDQAVQEDGKWYVERRERAASLKELQIREEKEKEERLFIEEQYRIEQQIMAQLAAASSPSKKTNKKSNQKKRAGQQQGRNRKLGQAGQKKDATKKDTPKSMKNATNNETSGSKNEG